MNQHHIQISSLGGSPAMAHAAKHSAAQTCAAESPRQSLGEAVMGKLSGLLERLENASAQVSNLADRLIGPELCDATECRPPSAPGALPAMSDALTRAHDLVSRIDGSLRRLEREGL